MHSKVRVVLKEGRGLLTTVAKGGSQTGLLNFGL